MKILLIILIVAAMFTSCAITNRPFTFEKSVLRYNYLEDQWSYAREDAPLKFNHYEDRWEFAR
jgi:hypothetical protein